MQNPSKLVINENNLVRKVFLPGVTKSTDPMGLDASQRAALLKGSSTLDEFSKQLTFSFYSKILLLLSCFLNRQVQDTVATQQEVLQFTGKLIKPGSAAGYCHKASSAAPWWTSKVVFFQVLQISSWSNKIVLCFINLKQVANISVNSELKNQDCCFYSVLVCLSYLLVCFSS